MIFMISKTVRIFSTTTHTRAVYTHDTRRHVESWSVQAQCESGPAPPALLFATVPFALRLPCRRTCRTGLQRTE